MTTTGNGAGVPKGAMLMIEILAAVRNKSGSHVDIGRRVGADPRNIRRWLCAMERAEFIHVSGWTRHAGKGKQVPVFRFGPGDSVQNPSGLPLEDREPRGMLGWAAFRALWESLAHPVTMDQLHQDTGISGSQTLRNLLNRLRELGMVRVAGYQPRGDGISGSHSRLFQRGRGEDAPRPAWTPPSEVSKRYRARLANRTAVQALTMLAASNQNHHTP